MKSVAPLALGVAANALSEAEENLTALPSCDEVRDLERRWHALRTVVHGVALGRTITPTPTQKSALTQRAVQLATDVAEARRRRRR
jgi:hypothetical protein